MPQSSSSSSWVVKFLWTGCGLILGYLAFYALFQQECANLMAAKERQHNATLKTLTEQSAMALESRSGSGSGLVRPNDDASSSPQVQELLDKQTALASRYQELLDKHEVALHKLNSLEKESDTSNLTISKLQEQIKRLQRELGASTVQVQQAKQTAQTEVASLQEQLRFSQSLVRQKVDEVRALKVDGTCGGRVDAGEEDEVSRLQSAIRRRNSAQCHQALGNGPYSVEFSLQMTGSSSTFQVEFQNLSDMPHTVWTFLSLVDEGLYAGTTLSFSPDFGPTITGGEPRSGTKQVQSTLTRKYAETGFGSEPLMFEEVSPTAVCSQYSFGLVGRGPQIIVPLESYDEGTSYSCPGKIVKGKDVIEKIRDAGTPITIRNARILRRAGLYEEL